MSKRAFKTLLGQLDLHLRSRVPLVHQTESSECGLACLAMICNHFGKNSNLISLRQQFNLSARGTTLAGMKEIAEQLGLASRCLSLELHELNSLKIPCILHWDFNHFVVLVGVKQNRVILHDPARGRRTINLEEMSQYFTGIALEVWPGSTFTEEQESHHFSLKALAAKVHGLKGTLAKIFFYSLIIESINLLIPIGTQLALDHAIPAADVGLLTLICIGLLLFTFLRLALSALRSWSSLLMTTLINVQWQSGLFSHLLRLPLSYFERRKLGDIQSRFGSLNTLRETFTSSIVGALIDGTMLIGVVIMMALYGGWLTGVVMCFTALYVLIRLMTYSTYRELSEEILVRDARTRSYFMETLYGIATIKMQGFSERRSIHWLNLEIDTINTEIKITKMDLLFGGVNSLITACEQIAMLWLGSRLIIDNDITIGMFIAFGVFREQFADRVWSLTNFLTKLRMMHLHNERVADIALNTQEKKKPDREILKTMKPVALEINALSYRYDDHSAAVFRGLSFQVLAGESVAITGPSGAGKTTLMRVLCGLFEPQTGSVMIDGNDIQQLGLNNYRKIIGCVMQDDKLFSGSIRENICGFDENADYEWMEECARASFIHGAIVKMPMGYDTLVGELGEGLSGGQKQRIFIARALYRKPGILFMDEATSALDEESETYVNQAIKKLNITRIIIAHRQSTIASVERVIRLMPQTEQHGLHSE
ncbi:MULTISPECIES: peptidase domain-containing ABC transporter [Enterobacter]|uniref:peptidase domain-containing ABC transporter n=1 Tax=Enterobacter TaxID=547 RepID=UPI0005CFBAAD|nr:MULTISPECIES: peptidase domain-containing ABC transporter [Enterobacter]EKS7212464.1 peptidase domain-containing ABC transporter [Enterobacter ludwigii]MBO1468120.1 peptidase domain-containing ABC transporter [Enterobacter ludwigii]MBO1526663.1 peptidase domain-containing ABC transporter [Enterobacter ludwigii]QLW25381.1 peptidase domain-containing ABC transporter [Enterobacter sp. RHBSTW-00422]QLX97335.1 peptidase domain-containing ABC transporter [Enterobacter sp. RHBSTW-00593]